MAGLTSTKENSSDLANKSNIQSNLESRSVNFSGADIVEFEPTVWTASVTSGGIPIGMSRKVRKRSRRRLDSYEIERRVSRVCRQEFMEEGYLEVEERETILDSIARHRSESFDQVESEIQRINDDRRESNEADLKYQIGLGEADLIHEDWFSVNDNIQEDFEISSLHQGSGSNRMDFGTDEDAICGLDDDDSVLGCLGNVSQQLPYSDIDCDGSMSIGANTGSNDTKETSSIEFVSKSFSSSSTSTFVQVA